MWVPTQLFTIFHLKRKRLCLSKMDMDEKKCGCWSLQQEYSSVMWICLKCLSCVLCHSIVVLLWTFSHIGKDWMLWTFPAADQRSVYLNLICHDRAIWKDKLWLIEMVFDSWVSRFVVSGIWNPLTWANFTAWRLNLSCKAKGGVQTLQQRCVCVCVLERHVSAQIYEPANCF